MSRSAQIYTDWMNGRISLRQRDIYMADWHGFMTAMGCTETLEQLHKHAEWESRIFAPKTAC